MKWVLPSFAEHSSIKVTRIHDNNLVVEETLENPLLLNYHYPDASLISSDAQYLVEMTSVIDGSTYQGTTTEWPTESCLHTNLVDASGVTINFKCPPLGIEKREPFKAVSFALWIHNRPFDNHVVFETSDSTGSMFYPLLKGEFYNYVIIGHYGDTQVYICEESGAHAFMEVIPIDESSLVDFPRVFDGPMFTPETVFTITVSNTQVRIFSSLINWKM